ncbi:hypothetical protein SAMN05444358_11232 [Ruegeria halocynthiae]|uniref:Uncharacterized protein n=1 Tax=Ruegeria halocynthiae TaxID=985054 RepID=A0A1H3ERS6_9RHOB|nr:hypothetical protein SAMN05444358_11232 [Ruegeria halocynthiae]
MSAKGAEQHHINIGVIAGGVNSKLDLTELQPTALRMGCWLSGATKVSDPL